MLRGEAGSRSRIRLFVLAALLLLVSGTTLAIKWQSSAGTPPNQGRNLQGISGLAQGEGGERLTIEFGDTGDESQELQNLEDYWLQRVGYPTGNFET